MQTAACGHWVLFTYLLSYYYYYTLFKMAFFSFATTMSELFLLIRLSEKKLQKNAIRGYAINPSNAV